MRITLGEIADRFDLQLVGDAKLEITGIAGLQDATAGQLSFLFSSAYNKYLQHTEASAVVLSSAASSECQIPMLLSDQPRLAWANIASLFDTTPLPTQVIHESAVIGERVSLGERVSIGANAVIENDVVLADDVSIGAGCFLSAGVQLGSATRLHANVTLYHEVKVGNKCLIHSGAVIGADGFGFEFDTINASLVKIPQVYSVLIADDVEIGAGSTIDRGALRHTVISNGVKIDNQVVIGHGTIVGEHTAISGATAIAGSTKIGSYCLIGGAVGIIDNIEIADQVEVTAMSLVSKSITSKGRYSSGTGIMPSRAWKRSIVGFRKLDQIMKRLSRLEKKNR